jgi:uncharacterized protein YacL
MGTLAGLLLATSTLLVEEGIRKISLKNLLGSFIGLILGLMVANLIANVFLSNLFNHQQVIFALYGGLYGICGYMGLRIGFKKAEEIHLSGWKLFSKSLPLSENTKILDTSVIIDGRIADICETRFVEGRILVPRFVLNELQTIADSSDPLKRNRGDAG